MKKLLKSEVCGFRALFTEPTDGLKMAKKSKFSAIVHAQYMNSSLVSNFACIKKRKKRKKRKGKCKRGKRSRRIQLNPNGHYIALNA